MNVFCDVLGAFCHYSACFLYSGDT